jgi:hypothetical protein
LESVVHPLIRQVRLNNFTSIIHLKLKYMERMDDLVSKFLQKWKRKGYTDTIIVEDGLLLALNRGEYFPVSMAKEVNRVNIYDEFLSGSAWSLHALTLNKTCKGILILGGEIYNPWELTSEIREAFEMPPFSSDNLRMAS